MTRFPRYARLKVNVVDRTRRLAGWAMPDTWPKRFNNLFRGGNYQRGRAWHTKFKVRPIPDSEADIIIWVGHYVPVERGISPNKVKDWRNWAAKHHVAINSAPLYEATGGGLFIQQRDAQTKERILQQGTRDAPPKPGEKRIVTEHRYCSGDGFLGMAIVPRGADIWRYDTVWPYWKHVHHARRVTALIPAFDYYVDLPIEQLFRIAHADGSLRGWADPIQHLMYQGPVGGPEYR